MGQMHDSGDGQRLLWGGGGGVIPEDGMVPAWTTHFMQAAIAHIPALDANLGAHNLDSLMSRSLDSLWTLLSPKRMFFS